MDFDKYSQTNPGQAGFTGPGLGPGPGSGAGAGAGAGAGIRGQGRWLPEIWSTVDFQNYAPVNAIQSHNKKI